MNETSAAITAYRVPLQKSNLLLPNATVAEIISYEPLQRIQDTPDWFLGVLAWRGVQVPVVSFEMLSVPRASFSLVSVASANLVVLKAIGSRQRFQYFAVVAQTLPEALEVTAQELKDADIETLPTEQAKARLGDEILVIPNIDYLETRIDEVAFDTLF